LIRHPLIIAPIGAQRQALLTERLRLLHACSGCFRLERIAGWALHPLESAALSRRTPRAAQTEPTALARSSGPAVVPRGMNTGDISVDVEYNFVTRLVQCGSVRTIEGIGTQVTGTSRLRATLFGNTEANNGSPGANMDSLFVNPAEEGVLSETIDNNVYMSGIGGASTTPRLD
jgi:hypothetical protein